MDARFVCLIRSRIRSNYTGHSDWMEDLYTVDFRLAKSVDEKMLSDLLLLLLRKIVSWYDMQEIAGWVPWRSLKAKINLKWITAVFLTMRSYDSPSASGLWKCSWIADDAAILITTLRIIGEAIRNNHLSAVSILLREWKKWVIALDDRTLSREEQVIIQALFATGTCFWLS